MATLVYIDKSKPLGQRTLNALRLINQGLAELKGLDGVRAQLISSSQAAMAEGFGCHSNASAQALSDRIGYALAQYYGGTQTWLSDLVDAAVDGTAPN
jgi:hypothetical protein